MHTPSALDSPHPSDLSPNTSTGLFVLNIMGSKKMRVSLVGLGFGAEFIPIYQAHPLAEIRLLSHSTSDTPPASSRSICQRTESKLNEIGDQFNIARRHTNFEDVLADPEVQPYRHH